MRKWDPEEECDGGELSGAGKYIFLREYTSFCKMRIIRESISQGIEEIKWYANNSVKSKCSAADSKPLVLAFILFPFKPLIP